MRIFSLLLIISFIFLPLQVVHAKSPPKTWTFLIFLNGNNNLDYYGTTNLIDMEKVGSNDQVNIVVQWASIKAGKTVRLLVQKSTDPNKVTSPILEDLGKVDMGDYRNLQDFIAWGVKNFPAEHYFVDVWNHGSGWNLKKIRDAGMMMPEDISYDDISGNHITTEQLGLAMANAAKTIGHKVDLYASDACLMGMAEVADELSDSVHIYAGSQEVEPGAGWSYYDLLNEWTKIPNASPEQVANVLVDTYVKSYQGGSNGYRDVTYSAYDLEQIAAFDKAMQDFSKEVAGLNASDRDLVLRAGISSQSFANWDFHDLLDFVKIIKEKNVQGIKPETLAALETASSHFIIANKTTEYYQRAKGISIWLPGMTGSYKPYEQKYKKLIFDQHTHWSAAIEKLLQVT